MTKMMTRLDVLLKHVIVGGFEKVNEVGTSDGLCTEDEKFEAMYNKEVPFLSNQAGGSRWSYPRPSGN